MYNRFVVRAPPALLLLAACLHAGCVDGGRSDNPPPDRPGPFAQATPAAASQGPRADGAAADPREAVTHLLIDLLSVAGIGSVRSPHARTDSPTLLEPTLRSFPEPWAAGQRYAGLRQRLAWTTGTRNRWDLRAALALPSPSTTSWLVRVPRAARLRFGLAVGTSGEPADAGPVRTTVRVVDADGRHRLWSVEARPTALGALQGYQPVEVDLARFGGQTVRLEVEVDGDPVAPHRDTVMLAEPVLTTTDSGEAEAATGLAEADNVLLIVVDAQRADTVSPVRKRVRLPAFFSTMEALVSSGTAFTEARSVGNQTRLSTYAFLSGQLPRRGGFHHPEWDLPPEFKAAWYARNPPMLGRVLRKRGYRTVSIGNDAFMFGNLEIGLDAGFDAVTDHRNSLYDTPWMTDTAIEWLANHRAERFFMVLNYNAPHTPYQPPDEVWEPFKPKLAEVRSHHWRYLGEIEYVDRHMRRVLAALESLELRGRTLVVFTSDHGEVMSWAHQCFNHTLRQRCRHSHGKTLYDEEVHVPLVFSQPGRVPAGRVIDAPLSQIDLAPTILSLLGVPPEPLQDGRDFSAAIRGTGPLPPEAPIFCEARFSTAVVAEGHKYIVHDPRLRVTFERKTLLDPDRSMEELYDLRADPWELQNLAWTPSPELDRMRSIVREHRRDIAARSPAAPWNTLRLHRGDSGGRFTGRIETAGRFVAVEPLKGSRGASLESPNAVTLDVTAAEDAGFRFTTDPPDATLRFLLALDGEPLRSGRFFVGAYGLSLLEDPPSLADGALKLAASGHGPAIAARSDAGAYFWRDRAHAADAEMGSGPNMDGSVEQMMRDWGYQ